jgi:hypothetical protein
MKHWQELAHDAVHTVMIPLAAYLWNERRILKEVLEGELERRMKERRHTMELPNLKTVINGVELAEKDALALSALLLKLPEYAPIIQKQFEDLQKAIADKNNPIALINDTSVLLGDLNQDMSTVVPFITNLIPALKAQPPAAA